MKYYLAGPMNGLPQLNFPVFDRVAASLRKQGYDIVSPSELDSPEERAAALKGRQLRTWGELLSRDVLLIANSVQGMILLPGWERSRGAKLEATVGLLQKDFRFLRWDDNVNLPVPLSRTSVACAIHAEFMS